MGPSKSKGVHYLVVLRQLPGDPVLAKSSGSTASLLKPQRLEMHRISLANADKGCSSVRSRGCVADFTECQIKAFELCKSASRGDFEHVQFRPLKEPLRGFDAHA